MITTKRLVLKEWSVLDKSELFKLASNIDIAYKCGFVAHKSEEYSKNVIREILQKRGNFAVKLKTNERLIGSCGLKFCKNSKEAEIGYWIGEEFLRQGYCFEAASSLISYAFNFLKIEKVFASVMFYNVKSANLLKKLGFIFFGLKSLEFNVIDEVRLSKIFLLLKENFRSFV